MNDTIALVFAVLTLAGQVTLLLSAPFSSPRRDVLARVVVIFSALITSVFAYKSENLFMTGLFVAIALLLALSITTIERSTPSDAPAPE